MTVVTFTDAAIAHIQHQLANHAGGKGFRLSIKKTGCSGYSYVPDIIEDVNTKDLHFVAQAGLDVYIDTESKELLQGVIVDYGLVDGDNHNLLKQKRLIFINPNEKNRCGCGESFTV